MSETPDIVIDDDGTTDYSYIDLIESQLTLITTMCELDGSLYDAIDVDKIKAVSMAMKIIHKSQKAILEAI